MNQADVTAIKQHGQLLAMTTEPTNNWQYWLHGEIIYALNTDGNPDRAAVYCAPAQLPQHLRRLRDKFNADQTKTTHDFTVLAPTIWHA